MKRTTTTAILAAILAALTGCADWPITGAVTYQDENVEITGSKSGLVITGRIDNRSGK